MSFPHFGSGRGGRTYVYCRDCGGGHYPDDLRNRMGRGAVNLAAIRRLIVNLQDDNLSFRRRLLKAAHTPEYCLEIIANAVKLAETI